MRRVSLCGAASVRSRDRPVRRRGRLVWLKNDERRALPPPFRCMAEPIAAPFPSGTTATLRVATRRQLSGSPFFRWTNSPPAGVGGHTDWPLCRALEARVHSSRDLPRRPRCGAMRSHRASLETQLHCARSLRSCARSVAMPRQGELRKVAPTLPASCRRLSLCPVKPAT
jgi:hypothetical protein